MYEIYETKTRITDDNDAHAEELRRELEEKKVFFINLMGSPGAGKTSTLVRTINALKDEFSIGVMEADMDSDVDAQTISELGVRVIQLHTGGSCHMDADMTKRGLDRMSVEGLDVVILENVGNLVCPAEFDVGAALKVMILSAPEGDDKPLKYPLMYETCQLLIINKTDVLDYFDFDRDKVVEYAKMRNPDIEILFVSAKTGEGIPQVAEWILHQVEAWTR
jgi:hydrogenase nickel incorporation protein HypB